MLTVTWHDEESEGYTDLLLDEWFFDDSFLPAEVHNVRGPRSGFYKAMCNVNVSGLQADLDYETWADFNNRNDMCLGIMRILFDSTNRQIGKQVLWKEAGSEEFKLSDATIGYELSKSRDTNDIDLLEFSTPEGRERLVTHLRRERSSRLVTAKKEAVFAAKGKLSCEACTFTFEDKYGWLGKNYCEVHHRNPLSISDERETSLNDLAILCSNCHRMIHRTEPMLSVEKFREIYLKTVSSVNGDTPRN